MASPSVTYTFSNGTSADATQVNQNFTDIINGVTDGTKDLSISALTCAGTLTANGSVTLGNSSVDVITISGSIGASIAFGSNASYDIGAATSGVRSLYIGSSGSFTTRLVSGATATHTLTLPATQGSAGSRLENDGSGNLSWKTVGQSVSTTTKTANYTLAASDDTIFVDGSGGAFTITLPTAVGISGKTYTITRTDNTIANAVTVDGDGTETIRGQATYKIYSQYESITIRSDGANWQLIYQYIPSTITSVNTITIGATTSAPTKGTTVVDKYQWYREKNFVHIIYSYEHNGGSPAAGTGDYLFSLPANMTADTNIYPANTTNSSTMLDRGIPDSTLPSNTFINVAGSSRGMGFCVLYSTTQFRVGTWVDATTFFFWGSGAMTLGNSQAGFGFNVKIPISGWEY